MKQIFLFLFLSMSIVACAGQTTRIVHTDDGRAYKMEEVYSIGLFTPTYQWKRTSECEVEVTRVNSPNSFGDGYDSKSVKNCQRIGGDDGFTPDVASPAGPAFLQAGATVGAGALIKEGLENQPTDNISLQNSSQSSSGSVSISKSRAYSRSSSPRRGWGR